MIIRALDYDRDWYQIAEHMDITFGGDTGGMVLEQDGRIAAASIFDNWTYNTVNMHMLILNPRDMVRNKFHHAVFDYIFTTSGRKYMLGFIADSNKRSLRLAKRFGCTEKARIEEGYASGIDLVITELKRENCPYWAGARHAESTKAA